MQPPIWVPFAWWATLVGVIVASTVGDPAPVCSTAAPCQPDAVFPLAVALMGVAALAFWWFPRTALAAGLGYAILGVAFDPSVPGRYAAATLAALAAGCLAVSRAIAARQAQLARESAIGEPTPSWAVAPTDGGPRLAGGVTWLTVAAGLCGLVLAAAAVTAYQVQTAAERVHLARAVPAHARVLTHVDDDYRQVFAVQDGPEAGRQVRIGVADELDMGTVWNVLIDPVDPTWTRLVSQPKGYTDWFGWALLGVIVAGAAAARLVSALAARGRRDEGSLHQIRTYGDLTVELLLRGHRQPVATVRLGSLTHSPPPGAQVAALVRGPVAAGSWVSISTGKGGLPVVGPLVAQPRWRPVTAGPRLAALIERLGGPHGGRVRGTTSRTVVTDGLRGIGQVFVGVITVAGACVLFWLGLHQAGPAWAAAHGDGVPGLVTVTRESCGRWGCHYSGDFVSRDGQYRFADVDLVGASGPVGSTVPVLYEGHGARDAVYGHGWGGLVEAGLFVGMALVFGGSSVYGAAGYVAQRRQPGSGRHARRRR